MCLRYISMSSGRNPAGNRPETGRNPAGIRPESGRTVGRAVGRSGFFFFEKNTFLDFWNMYFVDFVISERFQGPLVKKIKI